MRAADATGRALPILHWLKTYDRHSFASDALGAAIVSFMFLPQSLAYALLAGLPLSAAINASILPLVGYAIFGTSRFQAIGPVAITSMLTASALSQLAAPGSPEYSMLAVTLALISGLMLVAMGLMRFGFLSNFLSIPVVSGYTSASAILIALSQVGPLTGISTRGDTLTDLIAAISANAATFNPATVMMGSGAVVFLIVLRIGLRPLLMRLGMPEGLAGSVARMGPLLAAILGLLAVLAFHLDEAGVKTVGALPSAMPALTLPSLSPTAWHQLLFPAFLISLVGFVSSISVAQTLAARHRQLILPDNELLGLGAANVIAGFCGAFPVTGGFSRSAVNYDAGVKTPIASLFTAAGIALVITLLGPEIAHVPRAVLAATIIVAVANMTDIDILRETWRYSKPDFAAVAVTILVTLFEGVQWGLLAGVLLSLGTFLYRTSRPEVAIVGLIPGTQHFRSQRRHAVVTSPQILSLRVDASLYFANARYLEEELGRMVVERPGLTDVVLICSAVNMIDASALVSLEALNDRLKDMGVRLHLSEIKGPVMDRLRPTDFLRRLNGQVFLSHFQAISTLDPDLLRRSSVRPTAPQGAS